MCRVTDLHVPDSLDSGEGGAYVGSQRRVDVLVVLLRLLTHRKMFMRGVFACVER